MLVLSGQCPVISSAEIESIIRSEGDLQKWAWEPSPRKPPRFRKKGSAKHIETDILSWRRFLLASLGIGFVRSKIRMSIARNALVECFLDDRRGFQIGT
jgi:hypothetical protein